MKQINAGSHAVKQTCCGFLFLLQQRSHKVNYVLSTGYVQHDLNQQLYMYKCAAQDCDTSYFVFLELSASTHFEHVAQDHLNL